MKRLMIWGTVAAAAVAVAVGGLFYYRHERRYPSTNDAYVKADVVNVASQVAGQVNAVPVSDQTQVSKGQLLFRVSPARYRNKVREARAKLNLARQTVQAEEDAVSAAQAAVDSRKAKLDNSRKHFRRVQRLVEKDVRPASSLDDARAALDTAQADLRLAKARLRQARTRLGTSGDTNQRIQQAKAALNQAQLDLRHTTVKAPCAGRVSDLKLNVGDTVAVGKPQFALVCTRRYWVYANFKETDLDRIRPGQVTTVSVDMYPNHVFHGIVESVNPASGTAFSLLPPENATGNWVKVSQRVPVRILIVDADADYPLRVQTSSEVSVDTGDGKTPQGRARGTVLSNAEAMQVAAERDLVKHAPAVAKR
jgi:membrane fusion protein (multidrug efflux system)